MTKFHPVGEKWAVTGPFGANTEPWTPERPHLGCDFGAPQGTPVKAPADGTVVTFANDGSFGAKSVCLYIATDEHYRYHLFAHLSARTVDVGDRVTAGMTIGFVGGWGKDGPNTYAPHLHWQRCRTNQFARVDGDNADPLAWLNEEEPVTRDEFEALAKRVKANEERTEAIVKAGFGDKDRLAFLADPSQGIKPLEERVSFLEVTGINAVYKYVDDHNADTGAHPNSTGGKP